MDEFTSHLLLELGLGAVCVGLSPLLRQGTPGPAKVLRFCGTFLLFGSLYGLTFYRHFSSSISDSIVLALSALILGALGLGVGGHRLVPESSWFRNRLLLLLGLVLLLGGYAVGADAGHLPRGEDLQFFDFGWYRTWDYAEWGCSLAAWCLWFTLALWCVGFGSIAGRKNYLNTGVFAVGLGAVTVFFDLIGTLMSTGMIFLAGGLVLVGSGFILEKWRRRLIGGWHRPVCVPHVSK
jgi:hypothetical protein